MQGESNMANQTQELERILTAARRQASIGNVRGARFYLEQAGEYAGEVGLDISARVNEIEVSLRK